MTDFTTAIALGGGSSNDLEDSVVEILIPFQPQLGDDNDSGDDDQQVPELPAPQVECKFDAFKPRLKDLFLYSGSKGEAVPMYSYPRCSRLDG